MVCNVILYRIYVLYYIIDLNVDRPYVFKNYNLNKNKMDKVLAKIPIFDEVFTIQQNIDEYNKLNDEYKIIQYIVSNSNTYLIESILESRNILNKTILQKNIYTNPGWIDNKTGILRCKGYNTSVNPHGCKRGCAINLCKRDVIFNRILKLHSNDNIKSKIYVGDGRNVSILYIIYTCYIHICMILYVY